MAQASDSSQSAFECNICLSEASDPVVTTCGHMFCWPCLFQSFDDADQNPCPVCRRLLTQPGSLIPLYNRGCSRDAIGDNSPDSVKIPPRPQASRANLQQGDCACERWSLIVEEYERAASERWLLIVEEHKRCMDDLQQTRDRANQREGELAAIIERLKSRNAAMEFENHRLQTGIMRYDEQIQKYASKKDIVIEGVGMKTLLAAVKGVFLKLLWRYDFRSNNLHT